MPILRKFKSRLRKLHCFPTFRSRTKYPRYSPPRYPAMSFPDFPSLPTELRLKIWDYACPSPRMVELSWNSKARSVVSKTAPPALLSACHESRANFIKGHEAVQLLNWLGKPTSQKILVAFSRDTLFLGSECKHLIPAGKSKPWVTQNTAILRTILRSGTLMSNLRVLSFDAEFIIALTSLDGLIAPFNSMEEMKEVAIQAPVTGLHSGDVEVREAWQVVHRAILSSEATKRLKINAVIDGRGPNSRVTGAAFLKFV